MFKFSRPSLFHIILANTSDMLKACNNDNPARKWQGILFIYPHFSVSIEYSCYRLLCV